MKPYYERDGATIYHADVFELLDTVKLPLIHAVVTDPPYASGGRTEASKPGMKGMLRGTRWANKPIENDAMTTTGFIWMIRNLVLRLKPNMADGAAFFAFIDWRQWATLQGAVETTNLRVNGMIVWDKESFGTGNAIRRQHELVLMASKGSPRVECQNVPDVLRHKRVRNDDHPSPKPVGLMEQLLSACSTAEDVVFDPFMGSGATLVAGKGLRRQVIGVEIVERYCELAARKLDAVMRG